MDLRTYRAATIHEALALVRRELGPDAAVLHTREVKNRRFWVFPSRREIEVTASREVHVPSRLPAEIPARAEPCLEPTLQPRTPAPSLPEDAKISRQMQGQLSTLQAMVQDLCRRSKNDGRNNWPEELFLLFTELLEADFSEDTARGFVEQLRDDPAVAGMSDVMMLKARVAGMIEDEFRMGGPIRITPGRCRLAALVGPTGVGKTTTIAKLAANFRLKEKRRVGLITVDTYRIAAVEQLRTYADIIDLPMHVVSTPREMRETVRRLSHLDLILLDTAGRSPRDEVRIQELKAFLGEASADEVHLVLSSVSASQTLAQTAQRFAAVGVTSLILTKLDEAGGLGNLLPLLRGGGPPLSYLTDGQNVPDDIEIADANRLSRLILQLDGRQLQTSNI